MFGTQIIRLPKGYSNVQAVTPLPIRKSKAPIIGPSRKEKTHNRSPITKSTGIHLIPYHCQLLGKCLLTIPQRDHIHPGS
jgi:hypothetical protein